MSYFNEPTHACEYRQVTIPIDAGIHFYCIHCLEVKSLAMQPPPEEQQEQPSELEVAK